VEAREANRIAHRANRISRTANWIALTAAVLISPLIGLYQYYYPSQKEQKMLDKVQALERRIDSMARGYTVSPSLDALRNEQGVLVDSVTVENVKAK
jgi:hypothetical protein